MNICIPVTEDKGLQSPVCAHFGSAPQFLIVDTGSGTCRAIPNRNQHHAHGMCQPLAALVGESIDGIVVGGIGMGALQRLQAGGVRVFLATQPTVEASLAALADGTLAEASPATACGHHGHGPSGHAPNGDPWRHGQGQGGRHGRGQGRGD
jgi:predicted Fe-Mo cluster-binding NifX family protein